MKFFRCLFLAGMILGGANCQSTDLPVLGKIPGFELLNQENRKINSAELQGKIWVANFIFTSCAGTCPLLTQRMLRVQNGIQELLASTPNAPVRIVSFSVDPERDTPEKLAAYADRFGVNRKIWWFLTGPLEEVTSTVVQGFKISMGKVAKATPDAAESFDVVHGEKFVLIDREGKIRGYYASEESREIRKLMNDLRALLNGPSS